MIPVVRHPRAFLFNGDSAQLGTVLKPGTVDAIVTDPPAGIGFMGKSWDGDKGGRDGWIAWLAETLRPSFDALKPGGFGLVWALPRTSHWTALAVEAAGFTIRDRVGHLFGTGFPKSATEKSAGLPAGRGTALKPACEDWWLVQKPFRGTIRDNVATHGTGALNIDGCRVGDDVTVTERRGHSGDHGVLGGDARKFSRENPPGRWPAHVLLSHLPGCRVVGTEVETIAKNDEPAGDLHTEGWGTRKMSTVDVEVASDVYECEAGCPAGDLGPAARYFYTAKPSTAERDLGCDGLPVKTGGEATDRTDGSAGLKNPRAGAGRGGGRRNYHPTVKSTDLMRWLCRLVAPPGGVVLDPFTGSGSTAVAALAEGFSFVGCEQGADYVEIAKARIEHALRGLP